MSKLGMWVLACFLLVMLMAYGGAVYEYLFAPKVDPYPFMKSRD